MPLWVERKQKRHQEIESDVTDERGRRVRIAAQNAHYGRPTRDLNDQDRRVLELRVQDTMHDGSRENAQGRLDCTTHQNFFSDACAQSCAGRH